MLILQILQSCKMLSLKERLSLHHEPVLFRRSCNTARNAAYLDQVEPPCKESSRKSQTNETAGIELQIRGSEFFLVIESPNCRLVGWVTFLCPNKLYFNKLNISRRC